MKKFLSLVSIILFLSVLTYADNRGLNWEKIGRQDQQTRICGMTWLKEGIAIAVAGVADGQPNGGHIFRTTDYGENWTDLGNQYGVENIWSIAYVCANSEDVVLAGTGEDGLLLRSTSKGLTWTNI